VLRTERSSAIESDTATNGMTMLGRIKDLSFEGDMEAALAMSG
jgi:hypothetical protein